LLLNKNLFTIVKVTKGINKIREGVMKKHLSVSLIILSFSTSLILLNCSNEITVTEPTGKTGG